VVSPNGNGHQPKESGANKPRLIFWEVAKGSNLPCIHCRATATELSSPTDLLTLVALDIIDSVSPKVTQADILLTSTQ